MSAKQKNDWRDAELILYLLLKEEFPQAHCPPSERREVQRLLRYRHRLVKMRTMAKNSLQALALSSGSANQGWVFDKQWRDA